MTTNDLVKEDDWKSTVAWRPAASDHLGVCKGSRVSGHTQISWTSFYALTRFPRRSKPVKVWETYVGDMVLLFHNVCAGSIIYPNKEYSPFLRQKTKEFSFIRVNFTPPEDFFSTSSLVNTLPKAIHGAPQQKTTSFGFLCGPVYPTCHVECPGVCAALFVISCPQIPQAICPKWL